MVDESMDEEPPELVPRDPEQKDLVSLCRELNLKGAAYVVVGGFAIMAAGYARFTEDVDLLIDTDPQNERKVFEALMTLPDQAVKALNPGDVAEYTVVRIGDEIVVDLMESACGIRYEEASTDISWREIDSVRIPFASPRMLWRMKCRTHREKDIPDLIFLRRLIEGQGGKVPE